MSEESSMREALRIRAGDAGPTSMTLDDVQARARTIRHRRAGLVASGAAVLVAAAVTPVALLVGGESSRDTLPPAGASTVSDTANPMPVVDQRGSYVVGDQIHPAEGEPFAPDVKGEIAGIAWLEDGRWVVTAYTDAGYSLVVTDATGRVLSSYEARQSGLARDDAGTAVGWIGLDSRPRVLMSRVEEPVIVAVALEDRRSAPEPVEILSGCTVEECALIVEVYDDAPDGSTDVSVALDGEVSPLDRLGLLSITDVSPDGTLITGVISARELELEYCSAVLVYATGEELWRTCEAGSFRFSPDGTKVLGIDAYADGFAHSFVQVREALTGELVGSYGGGWIFDEAWESAESFLVSQQLDGGTDQLVRVDADGSDFEVVVSQDGVANEPSPLRLAGG